MNNPIIIGGCPHSGTSILLRILGNHKNIYPISKEYHLDEYDIKIRTEYLELFDELVSSNNKKRWCLKNPSNLHLLFFLKYILNDPKFVFIHRDPYDTIVSLMKRYMISDHYKINDAMSKACYEWTKSAVALHLSKIHHNIITVPYSDLIKDPKNTIDIILNFLEEDLSEDILNFNKNKVNWYLDDTDDVYLKIRNQQINQDLFTTEHKYLIKDERKEKIKSYFVIYDGEKVYLLDLAKQLGYN